MPTGVIWRRDRTLGLLRFDVLGRLKRSGIDVKAVLARPSRERLEEGAFGATGEEGSPRSSEKGRERGIALSGRARARGWRSVSSRRCEFDLNKSELRFLRRGGSAGGEEGEEFACPISSSRCMVTAWRGELMEG